MMLVGHQTVQLKFPAPWVGHQSKGQICIMGLSMTIHPPSMERVVECQLGARFLFINSSGCVSLVVSDVFRLSQPTFGIRCSRSPSPSFPTCDMRIAA